MVRRALSVIPLLHQDGGTAILFAVLSGDEALVKTLLAAGSGTAGCLRDGSTALYMACQAGNTSIAHALVSCRSGVDPNLAKKDGDTPLFVAVRNSHDSIVKLLLQAGVDVNSRFRVRDCRDANNQT
jgi:ankyrin repeat protein